jgi:hypothetical protein
MWSSAFMPASMEITGTGLMVMSREDGVGYDVMGSEDMLPASGMGDISVGDAMYHVWMAEDDEGMATGELMGARYDDAIEVNMMTGDLDAAVSLSEDDEDTVANEMQTMLKVAGDNYSLGDLFGDGGAAKSGDNIVSKAMGEVQKLRDRAAALIDLELENEIGTSFWTKVQTEVNKVFGDKVDLGTIDSDADKVIDELDAILLALSEESAFMAATEDGGDGVFASAALSADDAAEAFAANTTEAEASFDSLGATRFGAASKMMRADAISDLAYMYDDREETADERSDGAGERGAFAYSTMQATLRTRHIWQGTGNAYYSGDTRAVSDAGNLYTGDISLHVRFAAEMVSGEITNLVDDEGASWEYLFANVDVDSILLPDARLRSNAKWSDSGDATVSYMSRAGVPRDQLVAAMWAGQLLGRDDDAGSQAIGTWRLGAAPAADSTSPAEDSFILAGGFGAMRGEDAPDIRPGTDEGEGSMTAVLPNEDTDADTRLQAVSGGNLKLTTQAFGADGQPIQTNDPDTDADETQQTYTINLEDEFARQGSAQWVNGKRQLDRAIEVLEKSRRILEADLDITDAKSTAWTNARNALVTYVFGGESTAGSLGSGEDGTEGDFPVAYDDTDNDEFVEAIDEALVALASKDALEEALDEDGIFYGDIGEDPDNNLLRLMGAFTMAKFGDVFDRVESRIQLLLSSTDYTRFGAWRRETNANAGADYDLQTETNEGDGPNSFAYSPLAKTVYSLGTGQTTNDPSYPAGARMTYEGRTVAVQGKTFLEGDAVATVVWGAATAAVGGTIAVSLSNLEDIANGDPLMYDDSTNDNVSTDLFEVGEIIISAVMVDTGLGFTDDGPDVTITFADAGKAEVRSDNLSTSALDGQFVGKGLDGPLAVLGTWNITELTGSTGLGIMIGDTDADGTMDDPSVSIGAIHGAFGAEAP